MISTLPAMHRVHTVLFVVVFTAGSLASGDQYFPARDLRPHSCRDVLHIDECSSIYELEMPDNSALTVYCDQTTDGGGWTVIQRRENGKEDFNRSWKDYENGFGDLGKDFWLGLFHIHHLTSSGNYSLRVDLTDWDGSTGYALYDTFYIDGPSHSYRLHVAGYSGTIGDSLSRNGTRNHNNMQFSTPDRDNDQSEKDCAGETESGWWFNRCYYSNLNGRYGQNQTLRQSIGWLSWNGRRRTYRRTFMMIRPS